ncbi:N-acetyl-gamma-glutamyl-phosphate reductase [Bathymodiolus platifrons methanotrophic gill symbiont]|uniref:N-acetyl-gamma-glutamyl-phosphate reductase n=1 Tax=Bathymodiolus platifrons methanotrophic gill symbiont TaxID=113268 RepID=UPI0011CC65B5|nr:N-acetyl-gamma-glutamyl-phosphate reductase [Bathymodiolus platifrons methanotrophic gill symbiont]TXL01037.1 N-acetyl-gamma-glutamyl-phosphate reductase [Methylococcaceae bacterium HT1]TXL18474.1 N-acetyl-gamma-glutamyl-phosphate reductase [Methylococcaceae bacterium HT3]TXL23000.1 N-acetyl-gamma-glutamyl-phosphate reductase [Methylococcaceae bacterium HT2]GFO74758.1 N-acetyl-gamma-glutamyl-phosphate reductase [Bathymodiolus platifrons methanotrophic gill symbiont]
MIRAGIVGGTGYTGVELLRILALHEEVEVAVVTSRSDDGMRVDALYPSLRGNIDICFTKPDVESLAGCDVVFFATPNGTAMLMAEQLLARNVKVIDLSADFRIKDAAEWAKWYGMEHACPDLISEAVYGLPEINRAQIADANLLACPGCYPTAVQLGFLPLIEQALIDSSHLIADVKSGVSGAGRKASVATLMSETGESFKAYASSGHRHLPEITQGLSMAAGKQVGLTFVPHLVPMIRGIHATLYAQLEGGDVTQLQSIHEQRYALEPFVDVLPAGVHPDTRNVRGSNNCQVSIVVPQGGNTVVILSVIDNLVKGAAGQAVQNMNLMFAFNEKQGLQTMALYP